MKKTIKIIVMVTLAMFAMVSSHAQNSNNEDKLVGTWTLDYNKTINNIEEGAREYYDSLGADRKQSLQTSYSQRSISFGADGSYTLVVNANRQVTGTWKLKQDGVTLELVTNNRTITHTIGNISNQNLKLHLQKSSETKQLLETWHLDRTSN